VNDLTSAFDVLIRFLGDEALTQRIARLEYGLADIRVADIPQLLTASHIDVRLLQSALLVREQFGRLNDVVHASAITLALPHLLEPDEQLARPSLAAGNDPSRRFDVETDRRVAEFKLSRWQGKDSQRKRQVFKGLVHLASEGSERRAELYVLGQRPVRFLRVSQSTARWALDRPSDRQLFEEKFGSLDRSIAAFTAGEGGRVGLIDLEEVIPTLFTNFDGGQDDALTAESVE